MTKTSGNPRSAASLRAALIVVLVASIATGTGCSGGQNAPVSPVTPSDARGAEVAFDHAGLTTDCASCHGTNQPFAAFPVAVHRPTGGLDCSRCHAASSATGGGAWGKGRFHVSGSAAPATCLECHAAAAPASTAGWLGTSYATSPFDYGINSLGVPHGGGQDCGVCHAGPGTGAWGNQPSWVSGHFEHGPFSLAEQTCIACHVSQRPDLQPGATAETMAARLGFDHAPLATMDCIGCHWATVASGTYVNYSNPATSTLPGGDWQGGQSYPGARPVGFPGEHLELETTTLTLSAAKDRVLSAAVGWEDLRDLMIHTSAAVPPEVRPGLAGAPDYGRCWHCHANQHGLVTMYPRGHFHGELARYAVTPDAPVTPLPQPTRGCKECHAATLPTGIVAGRACNR
jgi:hypothetical protein